MGKNDVFVSRIDRHYILVVRSTNAEARQEVRNRQVNMKVRVAQESVRYEEPEARVTN